MPRSRRLLANSRQCTSASERAQETPSIILLPSSRARSDSDEGGAIPYGAVDTDFVEGRVEGEVDDPGKRPGTPFFELGIKLHGELGHLRGGYLETAEFFHDFGHPAGAHTFDIHGGDGGFESAVAA